MVAIANSRWPNTWASNPALCKSALRQNHACRPWQSEHERAPLGWISRGSTYAHCACAGQPPLTHTLDRRLISVTPHSSPFSPEAVEPMLSWSSHKKEVGLGHRSPSGAPPGISSTESAQCRSPLPFLLSYSKLKTQSTPLNSQAVELSQCPVGTFQQRGNRNIAHLRDHLSLCPDPHRTVDPADAWSKMRAVRLQG